jgi:FkbM family methyltransferase
MRDAPSHDGFINAVVTNHLWGDSDLYLVDVGASGGIQQRWGVFGNRLRAVGFDPLIAEVERLNRLETRTKVRYEAGYVGCAGYDALFPPAVRYDAIASRYNQPFDRSSAYEAHRLLQKDYERGAFSLSADTRYSSRTIALDEYFAEPDRPQPDFLKIDTDGDDFAVLLGAAHMIDRGALLGVSIEVQFHGAVHEYANTFSNIDRFLRLRGFSLFDLSTVRYSRAALPAPFASRILAHTVSGQVNCGKAVYFRDLGHHMYERTFGIVPAKERLLKLCCLFVLYGLDDCAAELLVASEALKTLSQRAALLDGLTPRSSDDPDYERYVARFNADPSAWLPSSTQPVSSSDTPAQENARLRARVSTLKTRVRELKRLQKNRAAR